MQFYQQQQAPIITHNGSLISAHLSSCRGNCTSIRTFPTNQNQGLEYSQPIEFSQVLANKTLYCPQANQNSSGNTTGSSSDNPFEAPSVLRVNFFHSFNKFTNYMLK